MKAILTQGFYVFFAQSITRVIGFFYVIFLARNLGVSDFGLFSVALAYFSIISGFADFGFNRFLTREIAKDKLKAPEILWTVTLLRLSLTSVLFAVFSLVLYVQDPDKVRVSLILLATLAILPQAVALTLDAVFAAFQKLQFSAVALFISSISTVIAGFFLISRGFGTMGAVNALIFGQFVYMIALILFLIKYKVFNFSKVNFTQVKDAIKGSLPYGLLSVLGLVYFRIDTVLLSYLRGNFETGLYGVGFRFLEAATFVPAAFSLALFPVLARMHEGAGGDLRKIYFKSFKIMLLIGVFAVLGYFLVLPRIIETLLPNYSQSIPVIKILSLAIPFMFIHAPAVSLLLSTDKYLKDVLILSVLAVSFNIIANLIFIPKYGLFAAAYVTVLSEILSFVVFFLLIKKRILDKT
ncbi:MAG: O-antigen transporter related protein [uncultured bacterium]|uniref:Polysaccharide biosynthesis protein n=1 Tax=Candidatus Daviesbacteria bacterium GW2011_GWC2_40_12 TaxID=1618431 RepID=A0A0G0TXM2_9BACT|nr:MAG: O-antigen transporter related protein [uncultured bacterium]KKR17370.1 MAG: Polysaccharide biosynthesis protein [Candidatus Daviesbacteria bacterium GW2011_GWA2_39_33]KKR24331.1 MAG: Polysaccharide biosynthesis protein [Candidatus Daviesbacteria bacterium GW2011_GWB1_39_5]KKR42747.1 MAG: Polysaccharide biosynthesis protein [Candidatus Daviesbacteria bacterium GW2011_GWC2_40_12]OGE30066.1 MAG: hypothetical protein A3C29_01520 [Candidatus Daviesbacteria bacterium RIFCSPHIGHO2_02_FULL_40_1